MYLRICSFSLYLVILKNLYVVLPLFFFFLHFFLFRATNLTRTWPALQTICYLTLCVYLANTSNGRFIFWDCQPRHTQTTYAVAPIDNRKVIVSGSTAVGHHASQGTCWAVRHVVLPMKFPLIWHPWPLPAWRRISVQRLGSWRRRGRFHNGSVYIISRFHWPSLRQQYKCMARVQPAVTQFAIQAGCEDWPGH